MQVTQEPLDPCQVALTIEVEQDKVVRAVDRAYREYAKFVNVPGFRRGKAPAHVVRQRVPEDDVRKRTVELLAGPAYSEALQQAEIEPYAQPKWDIVQFELADAPFIFKAIVPLQPKVELGPYKGLNVEQVRYEFTEQDVDDRIEHHRQRAAEYPIMERPAVIGDLVVADVSADVEGKEPTEARSTAIELGADNIPGFDEALTGVSAGDVKQFRLRYPENYHDAELAGKEADFTVTVKEIREKLVPALNDELASKLTGGRFATLEALKADVRADLEKSLKESSATQAQNLLIDQIMSNATVEYPPILLENEIDSDVKDLLANLEKRESSLEEYLANSGKTREQLHEEFETAADRRIRNGLVLGKIVDIEGLALTKADVDVAITASAAERGVSFDAMKAYLEASGGLNSQQNRMQVNKVLDFLLGAAIIKEKVLPFNDGRDPLP